MITKIKTERNYLFDPSAQIIMRVEITGKPSVEELKAAIMYGVNEHDILNCKVLMDADNECYYVPRETSYMPEIAVCYNRIKAEKLVNEQCKREFKINEGELVRFVICKEEDFTEMIIIQHHLGGDGKSMVILIGSIMESLERGNQYIENKDSDSRRVVVFNEEFVSRYVEVNQLLSMALDDLNLRWRNENVKFDFSQRSKVFEKYWSDKSIEVNSFELKKDELNKLLKMCKEHNVTLNNLLTTIIIKNQLETRRVGIIVDVRHKENKRMGNYAGFFMLEELYDNEKDFWSNVEYIDELSKNQIKDRDQLLLASALSLRTENGLKDAYYFEDCKSKVVSDYNDSFSAGEVGLPICVSNLGVAAIKKEYGSYNIDKITFISPLAGPIHCNIAVVTINDTFVLNMSYLKGDQRFNGLSDKIEQNMRALVRNVEIEQDEYALV